MDLLPCPICGGGETRIDENHLSPTMKGPGALIGVVIHHWCNNPHSPGAYTEHREVRGRDHASAQLAYNRRPPFGALTNRND